MPAAEIARVPKRVVVLGGTSEIALAIVSALAEREPPAVALLGRDAAGLAAAAEKLATLGCDPVEVISIDGRDRAGHAASLADAAERLGGIDLVILAVGVLGERGGLPQDIEAALEVLDVNVLGAGSLLLNAAAQLRPTGGTIVVLSSVAGVRVRGTNAVYGASKAALDGLAQGLGDALHADGVRIVVVRPGFVRSRMTSGLQVPPGASTPEAVARAVLVGLDRGKQTIWAPPTLRWVMMLIGVLPRSVMRRIRV